MQTYPMWIYPGGDVAKAVVVQDEAEHRAKAPEDFPAPKAAEAAAESAAYEPKTAKPAKNAK
jgi:hypothetical protein